MKRITYIAMGAVLLCVCSWMTVPFTVPFTMQTFAVFCVLQLLGGKDGTAAVALYLLLGAAGLPVFSGFGGGVGHLLGPTGGYIAGFLLSGGIYWAFGRLIEKDGRYRWPALLLGLAVCYLAGTVWFVRVMGMRGKPLGFLSALSLCVFPYVIPDLLKMALSVYVCDRVRKYL